MNGSRKAGRCRLLQYLREAGWDHDRLGCSFLLIDVRYTRSILIWEVPVCRRAAGFVSMLHVVMGAKGTNSESVVRDGVDWILLRGRLKYPLRQAIITKHDFRRVRKEHMYRRNLVHEVNELGPVPA